MRSILVSAATTGLVLLAAPAHAGDCGDGGVVKCSRVELKVRSCKPFVIDEDKWIKKEIENRTRGDAAAEEKLRGAYKGVLVTGVQQGATPGACDGSNPVLHPTSEGGTPPSWFTTEDCSGFTAGNIVTVETPTACCTGGDEVPCLFLEKARATTRPVLPGPSRMPPPPPAHPPAHPLHGK